MAKKLAKALTLGVALIMCIGLFAGCGGNKYNAVVLSEGFSFKPEFLINNRTHGAQYLNENWDEEIDEWDDKYITDETSPEYRVLIIKNQIELDNIFGSFVQVDFEKEMILLYCYTDIYSRLQLIDKVNHSGTTLEIEFSLKKPKTGVKDASMPGCKQLVIKMDTLEIETAKFTKK